MELHCQTAKPQMAKRKLDEDFGLDEPKDPFLTVIVGTITRTLKESEWTGIRGFQLFKDSEQKCVESTWILDYQVNNQRSWEEVLDMHGSYSRPVEAFQILLYLIADDIEQFPQNILAEFWQKRTAHLYWSYWLVFFEQPNHVDESKIPNFVKKVFEEHFRTMDQTFENIITAAPDPHDHVDAIVIQAVLDKMEQTCVIGAEHRKIPVELHFDF